MWIAALVLVATFSQVGLGVFQAINVFENRRVWVVLTSTAQSFTALTLYKYAHKVETLGALIAFVTGGVLGGQVAMYVGRKRRLQKEGRV